MQELKRTSCKDFSTYQEAKAPRFGRDPKIRLS